MILSAVLALTFVTPFEVYEFITVDHGPLKICVNTEIDQADEDLWCDRFEPRRTRTMIGEDPSKLEANTGTNQNPIIKQVLDSVGGKMGAGMSVVVSHKTKSVTHPDGRIEEETETEVTVKAGAGAAAEGAVDTDKGTKIVIPISGGKTGDE